MGNLDGNPFPKELATKLCDGEHGWLNSAVCGPYILSCVLSFGASPSGLLNILNICLSKNLVLDSSIITEIMNILDSVSDCNRILETSLIEMAIKFDHSRVINYMDRLNRYDGKFIANLALQKFMFTAAKFVHAKFDLDPVLPTEWAENLDSIEEFAYCFDKEETWQYLAEKKKAVGLEIELKLKKNIRRSQRIEGDNLKTKKLSKVKSQKSQKFEIPIERDETSSTKSPISSSEKSPPAVNFQNSQKFEIPFERDQTLPTKSPILSPKKTTPLSLIFGSEDSDESISFSELLQSLKPLSILNSDEKFSVEQEKFEFPDDDNIFPVFNNDATLPDDDDIIPVSICEETFPDDDNIFSELFD